jgi:hypothetical protein
MQRSVDALVETISARYADLGWEVKSTGSDSVTVQLPYLVADVDTILEELHNTHGAAADLRLTENGAELQLYPSAVEQSGAPAPSARPPTQCFRVSLLASTVAVVAAAMGHVFMSK